MSDSNSFVDSNVWLYTLLSDPKTEPQEETRKRNQAIALLDRITPIVISTQVINEVCSVLQRKAKFNENQLKAVIQAFNDSCIITELNYDVLILASDLRLRYNFSFWDGLIAASAIESGADTLYSEDMQDGLIILKSLQIINPLKNSMKAS